MQLSNELKEAIDNNAFCAISTHLNDAFSISSIKDWSSRILFWTEIDSFSWSYI